MRRDDLRLARAILDEVTWLHEQVTERIVGDWARGIPPSPVNAWRLGTRWDRRVTRLVSRWRIGPRQAERLSGLLATLIGVAETAVTAYAAQPTNLRVRAIHAALAQSRRDWSHTATRIAVTETTRRLAEDTLRSTEATRPGALKLWVSSRDDRVRVSHRLADRHHPIPVTAAFLVGGVPMMYPGDPLGPPDEIINCRCELRIIPPGGSDAPAFR